MAERLSRWFANGIRSWPFLAIFVGWTVLWWGWFGRRLGDPSPYLQWSLYTTFLTELDLIVYGIYQRRQSNDDAVMQRNQLDTMRLLVALATEMRDDLEEALEPHPDSPSLDQETSNTQGE